MNWPRRLVRWFLGDYELYRILVGELRGCQDPVVAGIRLAPIVDPQVVRDAPDPELQTSAVYAGEGALGYGAWVGGVLAGVDWVWYGDRYRMRNFWPLAPGEAKSVQTTVSTAYRGRGLGTLLLRYMMADLERRGFRRVYGRIWHSNTPSVAICRKAGWHHIAFVAVVYPFGGRRALRLVVRRPGRGGKS